MFEHFADGPRSLDDRSYIQAIGMKPKGLWFSPSDSSNHRWQDFCSSEGFRLEGLENRFEFELDLTNIYRIDSPEGIDDFAARYEGVGEIKRALGSFSTNQLWDIDWPKLCGEGYKGILITPYIWERRLGPHMWYYGWDCASGCIWDVSAIQGWKPTSPTIDNLGKF